MATSSRRGCLLDEDAAVRLQLAAYYRETHAREPRARLLHDVDRLEDLLQCGAVLLGGVAGAVLGGEDLAPTVHVDDVDEHDLDAIAHPVSPTTALPLDDAAPGGKSPSAGHWDCAVAAVAGVPALAVPAGFDADGLPFGLELMGRAFDEATLISIAAGFEAHTDHRRLPPTTPPQD